MLMSHLKRQQRLLGSKMVATRISFIKLVWFHSFEMVAILVSQQNMSLQQGYDKNIHDIFRLFVTSTMGRLITDWTIIPKGY